ncbi:hypothetical protein SPSIL_014260 [Sporomusa silvacetica DSM 10669]|uniref:Uncharacterized protein n=1 Tax=Sporomusa silvacetica DSM 10669 TaxID=1123289 RepID=A0ABZ3II13_9FIRM|nr:hypothetical protein [Sporomusa silvacetica]OZC21489.1 hypothetical protein SPSIL_08990 [Sporomusa silvacetica DSM 10669]
MQTQLYLWDRLRKSKKEELQYIRNVYFERISPAFENAEKEAEEYAQQIWDNAMCNAEDYEPDFSSIAEACQEAGIKKYEILSLMRYRNLSMWISCLCQVWEQQLVIFVRKEMERDGYTFTGGTDFNEVKECLEYTITT